MANKKFNAQNVWASARNLFSTTWTWTKNICGGIIFFVIVLVRVICVYNPVLFPIWVLLGYRKNPGEVMFGEKNGFYDELWDAAPQAFCRWEVHLFPWFMKKDFIKLYPTSFAWEDQIKLALELPVDEKHHFVTMMEEEATELLWQRGDYACNMAIIKKRKDKLDEEMVTFLLNNGELDVIQCFISRNAPSTECIEKIIDATILSSTYKVAVECLHYTALKHGLSSNLINKIYEKCAKEDIAAVEEALVQRNQYLMVEKLRDCNQENQFLWEQFCLQNKEIWSEAQKLMRFWMLDMYYATGHNLSESAQVYFLSSSDANKTDIVKFILDKEKELGNKVISVIRAFPDVYTIYLQSSQVTGVGKV